MITVLNVHVYRSQFLLVFFSPNLKTPRLFLSCNTLHLSNTNYMNHFLGQGMKDDEICLHYLEIYSGFVLSGNFLYFTCCNKHGILISDIVIYWGKISSWSDILILAVILFDHSKNKQQRERDSESVCMCVCVFVLDGEGNRVFASRALVISCIDH